MRRHDRFPFSREADMQRISIIGAAALLLAATSDVQAATPTSNDISALIKAENPNTDLDRLRIVASGPIGTATAGATVVAYTTVITGGNFQDSTFGVFVERGGKVVRLANKPEPTGQVDTVAVRNGRILVHSMSFGPRDPHCCPSLPHTISYTVRGGSVLGVNS